MDSKTQEISTASPTTQSHAFETSDERLTNRDASVRFAAEYRHNGSTWALTIWADDWADAERKLRSIGTNGRIIGSDVHQIKVPNWLGRFLLWSGLMSKDEQ